MKLSKTIHQTAKNASKLHKRIGELLTCDESMFKYYDVRQEYRVSEINPSFNSNREKFDYIILQLKLVIEIHGLQHKKPCCFGGITIEEATRRFQKQIERDRLKKQAALDAGWSYLVIWYNEKDITLKELTQKAVEAMERDFKPKDIVPARRKQKIQSRGIQKPPEGYKKQWPKRKLNH